MELPASGIRFGRIPPTVGARWAVSVHARSTTKDVPSSTQVSEYTSSYIVEIVGTDGPAPSRVRLTFEKNVHRFQGVDKATAIDGKSYLVDVTAPHVRDGTGGPAAGEEAQRVLDVFPDLGTRSQIDQVLPDAAMTIGDERHDLASALLRVIHPRAWTLDKGTAVLARIESEQAVFTIAIDATGTNGLRMRVKGEAWVRLRDARLMSLVLDGNYERAKGSAPGSVIGEEYEGTFSLRRTVRDVE